MPETSPPPELHQRRTDLFRGLAIINSLNFSLVLLVAALGAVAIFLGWKARQDAHAFGPLLQRRHARADLAETSVGRATRWPRFHGPAKSGPSLALRNEAIAALTTADINAVGPWHHLKKLAFSPNV